MSPLSNVTTPAVADPAAHTTLALPCNSTSVCARPRSGFAAVLCCWALSASSTAASFCSCCSSLLVTYSHGLERTGTRPAPDVPCGG